MNKTVGLLISLVSVVAQALPSLERIQEIENLANRLEKGMLFERISFVQDPQYQGLAIVRKNGTGYQVTVNPNEFQKLSRSSQNLVMFHELGHVFLGHQDMDPAKKIREVVELEADYFAAFMFRRFDKVDPELEAFIQSMSMAVQTIPSGAVRSEVFRSILFENERP